MTIPEVVFEAKRYMSSISPQIENDRRAEAREDPFVDPCDCASKPIRGKTMTYTEGPQKLIARLRSVAEALTDERAQNRLFMAADEVETRFAEMAERTTRKKLLVRWGS